MQGIVDTVKEATGMMPDYPDKRFLSGFAPPDPTLLLEQAESNKAGERPGKQSNLRLNAVDDIYANGKPYVGANKLEGKKAIITGGDSGIGRSIAILFAIEGAESTICYLPSEQADAEYVVDYVLKKTGRTINLFAGDLKSEANCINAIKAHMAKFGKLDILVNNAAQQLQNYDITTLSSQQWEETFQLNIHHYFYMSKAAVPHLPRGGAIVNMCSINAFVGREDLLDYTTTKGAIVSFTRALSNQIVANKMIRVNSIAPGPIYTPLISSTFDKKSVMGINAPPMGRPGQPIEVATCAVFLASEDASYISGNVLHPNGGTVIS